MKIGELFRDREASDYPSPEQILAEEIARARATYPQHGDTYSDEVLLAFAARTLRKNLQERKAERDLYRTALYETPGGPQTLVKMRNAPRVQP